MTRNPSDADISDAEMREWLARWRRVGPMLARIENEELRDFDFEANRKQIAGLFELGVRHGERRTTSGLVELQRRLRRLRS